MRRRLAVLCSALLLAALARADVLVTLPLTHRSAEELIPLLAPALQGSGVGLSGQGDTLLVRGSPQQVHDVREALRVLDVPRRRLQVSVRQAAAESVLDGGAVQHYGTRRADDVTQAVQMLDGGEATLAVGSEVPVGQVGAAVWPGGFAFAAGEPAYRAATAGFRVRPRLSGDGVTIEVETFDRREGAAGDGRFAVAAATTTLAGPLGEWLPLALSATTRSGPRGGLDLATRGDGGRVLLIRVEVLP